MKDLVKEFKEVYHEMKESRDVANMRTFGTACMAMYEKLAKSHPDVAEEWLMMLAPISYHNYLTESEADEIAAQLVNQDGREGAHWSKEEFNQVLNRLGIPAEDKPYYNRYALWLVMNMIYSDHAMSIAEDMGAGIPSNVSPERMAKSCYRKAVEKLKDIDHPRFVRSYYHLE
jgi:hypothetical protein